MHSARPRAQDRKRRSRESLLDADGICAVGEVAAPNDVLVNRQTPVQTKEVIPGLGPHDPPLPDAFYRPAALAWKGPPGQSVVVDKVLLTTNEDGHVVVKARARRPPPCHVPARSIKRRGASRRRAACEEGAESRSAAGPAPSRDGLAVRIAQLRARDLSGRWPWHRLPLALQTAGRAPDGARGGGGRRCCGTRGGRRWATSSAAGTARRAWWARSCSRPTCPSPSAASAPTSS